MQRFLKAGSFLSYRDPPFKDPGWSTFLDATFNAVNYLFWKEYSSCFTFKVLIFTSFIYIASLLKDINKVYKYYLFLQRLINRFYILLILISLSTRGSMKWGDAGVPGEKSRVREGRHHVHDISRRMTKRKFLKEIND